MENTDLNEKLKKYLKEENLPKAIEQGADPNCFAYNGYSTYYGRSGIKALSLAAKKGDLRSF